MTIDEDIAARKAEQDRLRLFLRQRGTLAATTACAPGWRDAQLADLDVCITATRALIDGYSDRILDTWQAEQAEHTASV